MKRILGGIAMIFALGTATVNAQNAPLPQQQIEVTDSELNEFAEVFQKMRMVNQEAQQEMMQVVQGQEMDLQRFNEIHQANMDPNKEIETTEAESKKYKIVVAELEEIQPQFQQRMEKLIGESELSKERYQEMVMALQKDPALQQRLQKVLQG
ncbi:DUF4168 domain-containing protein [Christiangramia portivictoriae]|uniref:DUF4168 domain-containing protein n=1 Tax=Christiangramia portivictoriae TaxID=326069 RepID=UPI0003F63AC2|nr:DUF4168 domain-containing protein [Christiangramia portivictoriae]